ncbi:hypothetical protein BRD17_00265 [Halobacteriales archaeon SW_7_68_16]|nr:MAG: hypothetical protein BRD17_00265 [Halobacteriales archaeon SW_7_68_16]
MAPTTVDELVNVSERLIQGVELIAAYVLVGLFAVGVFDLGLQIYGLVQTGGIFDPNGVVGLIDSVLLLFIIVEVYQTIVAYTKQTRQQDIVRIVIYAGIIAMVRKVIVFRTSEYDALADALTAAASYALILAGLATVLLVSYRYGDDVTLPAESTPDEPRSIEGDAAPDTSEHAPASADSGEPASDQSATDR